MSYFVEFNQVGRLGQLRGRESFRYDTLAGALEHFLRLLNREQYPDLTLRFSA
jgi:hypothetical protein